MSAVPKRCVGCGASLSDNLPGDACAACRLLELLNVPGESTSAADHRPGSDDAALVQQFGPYELLEEIGRGGMGVIYQARQPGLDRVVALKMLLAGEFADAKARERLLREARIAARLTHPGIVTIYDVGEYQGRPFFTMEYVPGQNLSQHCREGLLPVATAVRYLEQLARAVHYAHQHGVVHRDLKPANVLISPDDQPKLTDFGLTKSLIDPTRTMESAGSPNFMAPEQADSTLGPTGTLTDIFGLGAILYYLLTGRPPALGDTLSETLRNVVEAEPVPPCQLRPTLPQDLETITLRCLEKEPGRRFGTALDVAEELARWQRHEPILARPATPAERLTKWVRRRPVIAALSAACTLAVLLGFAGITWQWQRANDASIAARAEALSARQNAYVAEMSSANQAVAGRNWQMVRRILERTRPAPGQSDLRGWEWRYLWNISRIGAESRFVPGTNNIGSMAALEDGRTVALGEIRGGFSLWDAASGHQTYRLPESINRVRHPTVWSGPLPICRVAAVPGTGLLAYTECQNVTNGWVHLWDITRQQVIRSISVPGMPRDLAVSPSGRRLACSLMWPDKRTLIFEVATGQPVNTFESTFHGASQFNTLAFSADSRAVSLEDMEARCLRVVDVDTGNEQHRFALGQVYPLNAAFSPDGRWLVTGAGWQPGNRVIVWDLQTGERKLELPAVNQVAIQFDATGRRLVVGLSVYRVPEFTLEREFDGVNHMFLGALLMADGDTLLTTDDRGGILRWSLSSPAPERGAHALCGNPPNGGDWIPHESSLLLVTAEGTVVRAVPPRFVCEPVPALGSDVVSLTFVIERNQLALLHRDGSISLHDLDSRAEFARFRAKDQSVGWLFWMPETQALALRAENTLEIWDPRSQSLTWKVDLISGEDLIRPTKDGVLWQLHVDGRLFGYDVARKKVLTRQLDHNGMQRLAVSPDGRWLLTTSNEQPSPEGSKRLVDARTGKTVSQFQDADLLYPRGVAFWPHEPRAAFGAGHIVDLTTRRALLQLGEGNGLGVSPVVALGGSTLLIVGSQNRLPTYVWWAPSWEDIRWAEAVERAAGL